MSECGIRLNSTDTYIVTEVIRTQSIEYYTRYKYVHGDALAADSLRAM